MSAPNILYHHLPSHPSLNGNFVFLCGAFWDCCHQYTCYTSLEYPGFTPRGNAASSGPSTLTLYILTFLESTAERYFPSIQLGKHLTKRAPHPVQPTPAGSSDTLLTSRTCGVKMTALLWHSPWALDSSLAVPTQALPTLLRGWRCAHIGGHLPRAQGTCGADPTLHVSLLSTGVPEAYS